MVVGDDDGGLLDWFARACVAARINEERQPAFAELMLSLLETAFDEMDRGDFDPEIFRLMILVKGQIEPIASLRAYGKHPFARRARQEAAALAGGKLPAATTRMIKYAVNALHPPTGATYLPLLAWAGDLRVRFGGKRMPLVMTELGCFWHMALALNAAEVPAGLARHEMRQMMGLAVPPVAPHCDAAPLSEEEQMLRSITLTIARQAATIFPFAKMARHDEQQVSLAAELIDFIYGRTEEPAHG